MKSIKTVMAALFGAGLALLTMYAIESDILIGLDTFPFFAIQLQISFAGQSLRESGFSIFTGASRSPHTLQVSELLTKIYLILNR